MSESKHTPGPWESDKRWGLDVILGKAPEVRSLSILAEIHCDRISLDAHIANARLIAAAPELLEALEHCHQYIKHTAVLHKDDIKAWEDALESARAAIAKAKEDTK